MKRRTVAACLTGFVFLSGVSGCFGSRFAAEGRHGMAGRVRAWDCLGVGLMVAGGVAFHVEGDKEDPDPLNGLMAVCAIGAGVGAVSRGESLYERVEFKERRRRFIERERRVNPKRLRRMRKKKYLGWGLVVGGALLASLGQPEEGPDPSVEPELTGWDMAAQVSGWSVVTAGAILLLQSYGYEANVQLSVAPNGCLLTYRF